MAAHLDHEQLAKKRRELSMYPVGLIELFWALAGVLFFGIALYYMVRERQEYWRDEKKR